MNANLDERIYTREKDSRNTVFIGQSFEVIFENDYYKKIPRRLGTPLPWNSKETYLSMEIRRMISSKRSTRIQSCLNYDSIVRCCKQRGSERVYEHRSLKL